MKHPHLKAVVFLVGVGVFLFCQGAQSPGYCYFIPTQLGLKVLHNITGNLTITSGATLTVAGGSTVNVSGILSLVGNSTLLLQGKNNTGAGRRVVGWRGCDYKRRGCDHRYRLQDFRRWAGLYRGGECAKVMDPAAAEPMSAEEPVEAMEAWEGIIPPLPEG